LYIRSFVLWQISPSLEELQNILANVRRGLWVPPSKKKPRDKGKGDRPTQVPNFGPFATGLAKGREGRSPRKRPSMKNGRSGREEFARRLIAIGIVDRSDAPLSG
jgi:hypothetical protein